MKLPEVQFEKFTLPNGLDVILHEDHSIPMVAVNIWYHVGSRYEKPGRTGFAHLFEHMMFQGSQNHDDDYFVPLSKIGGTLNGSTDNDRTNYWENVPSNYLELALWLESDRMGFLLPAMTQVKLDNQRDVVKNERRQTFENQPYAKAHDLLPGLLFPKDHPYSWPVIGSMADLSAATIEDISEFFRTYYAPNNASLCVAGDFVRDEAKNLIEKYFASIPSGPPIDRLTSWVPKLNSTKRAAIQDQVKLPRLFYAWHSPAIYQPGDAEMDLLASIFTSGKTSRLYKALVYEQQIAQDVGAYQQSMDLGSVFMIQATAKEGHTLDELEKAVDNELRRMLIDGVTSEELLQAQNEYEAAYIRTLELIGGFGGRADLLNAYNIRLGDPGRFQWDLDRYTNATTSSVLEFAKQTFDLERRGILNVVPHKQHTIVTLQTDRGTAPEPRVEPAFSPPAIQTAKLSNGLELLLVADHRLPLVQMNVVIKSGWAMDPAHRPGTGSITAELLDEGTETRTALQISEEAKSIGAQLRTASSVDGSRILLNVVTKNLGAGLDLMTDILLRPVFPGEELERQREIYFGRIRQEAADPGIAARKSFMRALYGPSHPYGQPFTGSGTFSSIRSMQRNDLLEYYRANYVPNNAAVVISGDLNMDEAKRILEAALANWKPGKITQTEIPTPEPIPKTRMFIVNKPNAPQSFIYAGNLGISHNSADYFPCLVLNRALGGAFTSRINMNLREDKGYTYGARSAFLDAKGVGPFMVIAPVQVQSTKESILEILRELTEITEARPLTTEEVQDAKENIIKGFPQQFQTLSSIAGLMGEIVLYNLNLDYWRRYVQQISAVTPEMTSRAARKYFHPNAVTIVIVGDREKIEPGLRELNLGEISYLDPENF